MMKEDSFEMLIRRFPKQYRDKIMDYITNVEEELEEIRIRAGSNMIFCGGFGERISQIPVSREAVAAITDILLDYSVYAHMEEICSGYVTVQGGHRVGICGRAVMEGNRIKLIKDFSSLNIRRGRAVTGCAEALKKYLLNKNGEFLNTLVVSPPKCGKTTLLRDIVRLLSEEGFKISLVDERSEIAGIYNGIPGFDVGQRTDVMDRCAKAEGISLMVRSMSPDIVCTDEIGSSEDAIAIKEAVCLGVGILTSVHGNRIEELKQSRISELIVKEIFDRYVFLSATPKVGTIKMIADKSGKRIDV